MYQLFVCVNERISTGNKVEHRYNVFRVFIKKKRKQKFKMRNEHKNRRALLSESLS